MSVFGHACEINVPEYRILCGEFIKFDNYWASTLDLAFMKGGRVECRLIIVLEMCEGF